MTLRERFEAYQKEGVFFANCPPFTYAELTEFSKEEIQSIGVIWRHEGQGMIYYNGNVLQSVSWKALDSKPRE